MLAWGVAYLILPVRAVAGAESGCMDDCGWEWLAAPFIGLFATIVFAPPACWLLAGRLRQQTSFGHVLGVSAWAGAAMSFGWFVCGLIVLAIGSRLPGAETLIPGMTGRTIIGLLGLIWLAVPWLVWPLIPIRALGTKIRRNWRTTTPAIATGVAVSAFWISQTLLFSTTSHEAEAYLFDGVALPESAHVIEETRSKGGSTYIIEMDEPLARGDDLGVGLDWELADPWEDECRDAVAGCHSTYLGSIDVPSPRTDDATCFVSAHQELTDGREGAVLDLNIYCGYP